MTQTSVKVVYIKHKVFYAASTKKPLIFPTEANCGKILPVSSPYTFYNNNRLLPFIYLESRIYILQNLLWGIILLNIFLKEMVSSCSENDLSNLNKSTMEITVLMIIFQIRK